MGEPIRNAKPLGDDRLDRLPPSIQLSYCRLMLARCRASEHRRYLCLPLTHQPPGSARSARGKKKALSRALAEDGELRPAARSLPVTLATADSLATAFQTSLTAAAIRLVELGPQPAMVVCSATDGRRAWFFRSQDVPLWPHDSLDRESLAWDVAKGSEPPGPLDVDAAAWIQETEAGRYSVVEDSMPLGPDLVLSLLWWKDERQLIDATEPADD